MIRTTTQNLLFGSLLALSVAGPAMGDTITFDWRNNGSGTAGFAAQSTHASPLTLNDVAFVTGDGVAGTIDITLSATGGSPAGTPLHYAPGQAWGVTGTTAGSANEDLINLVGGESVSVSFSDLNLDAGFTSTGDLKLISIIAGSVVNSVATINTGETLAVSGDVSDSLSGNGQITQSFTGPLSLGLGTTATFSATGTGTGFRLSGLNVELDVSPVPEPGSLALLGLGGLCVLRRRR